MKKHIFAMAVILFVSILLGGCNLFPSPEIDPTPAPVPTVPPIAAPAEALPLSIEDLPNVEKLIVMEGAPYGFSLDSTVGKISINRDEVVQGRRSLIGKYNGSNEYNQILITDYRFMHFKPSMTYTARFKYKILEAPDKGFSVLFVSPKGIAENVWLPSKDFTGKAGDEGEASLTCTLADYDDYRIIWNINGKGAIAIDEISIKEDGSGAFLAEEDFEEHIEQGLLSFEITDTKIIPLADQGDDHVLRCANVADLDGDGTNEAVFSITTYPEQVPQPVIILGAASGVEDLTQRLFPNGVPKVRHNPFILFPDLDQDGRTDIVFADAGFDREPWTGSRMVIALQNEDGTFNDISPQIPQELWESRSYATAVGDIDNDGNPEIIFPDQIGLNTAALTWKNGAFTSNRKWIDKKLWSHPGNLITHTSLVLEDFDKDGWKDLIVGGNWSTPNTRIAFGSSQGFVARNLLTLPDGIWGHTTWEEWQKEDTLIAMGPEAIQVVADFDNDGLTDIFSSQSTFVSYKPGVFTDELEPRYQQVHDYGGIIAAQNTSIQVYKNLGNREFSEICKTDGTLINNLHIHSLIPFDFNGDEFLDVIGEYVTFEYGSQRSMLHGSFVFLNDGTGVFQVVDGSKLFPTQNNNGSIEQLGFFVPTCVTSDGLECLFVTSLTDRMSGVLVVRKGVYKGNIGADLDSIK